MNRLMPAANEPVRHRSFRYHWLLLLLALLLLAAQTTWDLLHSRRLIERQAAEQLANHSLVLTEELHRRLTSINTALLYIRRLAPPPGRKPATEPDAATGLGAQFKVMSTTLEGVRALAIFDARGTMVASNRPELVGQNFAHREYFTEFQKRPVPDRLHLTSPFVTALGVFSFSLARPIYGQQGQLAGVAVAVLDADNMTELLLSLHADASTRLAVAHGNGKLLQMVPARADVPLGLDLNKPDTLFLRHRESGEKASLMTGRSDVVKRPILTSMRTLQPAEFGLNVSLVVAVERDEEDILALWRQQLLFRLVIVSLVAGVTSLGLLIYQRRQLQFERRIQRTEGERRRSVKMLQHFLDHFPGTAYVKDADSRVVMANQGFSTVLGMDPATMIGKTNSELFPGEFGEKISADDQAALNADHPVDIEESFGGRDYESIKFAIDDGGGARYLGGITLDISARKNAERAMAAQMIHLKELNEKLEAAQNQLLQSEKMASIGQLAAGVAHELNNPIAFVISNIGTLEQYLQVIFEIASACEQAACRASNPEDFAAIEALKRDKDFDYLKTDIFKLMAESKDGLARVKNIVQDLKSFSHVGETSWQVAEVHAGIESTLTVVWNELKYKCTIDKQFAADLPPINCLPSQLNQVYMNLLVNAAQAIESKGQITIRTERWGEHAVRLQFSDTGKGIAPEHLAHIFEPFFTTKPVGQGTGLGLSIVWGIIAKHGGTIQAESSIGQGTTFTIVLPIEQAAQ